jgi:hypothetical protein
VCDDLFKHQHKTEQACCAVLWSVLYAGSMTTKKPVLVNEALLSPISKLLEDFFVVKRSAKLNADAHFIVPGVCTVAFVVVEEKEILFAYTREPLVERCGDHGLELLCRAIFRLVKFRGSFKEAFVLFLASTSMGVQRMTVIQGYCTVSVSIKRQSFDRSRRIPPVLHCSTPGQPIGSQIGQIRVPLVEYAANIIKAFSKVFTKEMEKQCEEKRGMVSHLVWLVADARCWLAGGSPSL